MITLALALLLPLLALASPIAKADSTAGLGPSGYPNVEPVRVAVLDSEASPGYVSGVLYNEYELAYELLASDPMLDVMVITSWGIATGELDDFDIDVLLLIDNVPETYANDDIKSWWENGGAIVALDSSIEFLCYAGILPAASEGSNGEGTYWDYATSDTTTPVELAHPILRGYHEDFYAVWIGFAGYYQSAMDDQPEWPYITMVAQDKANSDLMTITAYDPPDKGRVAHLWFSIWEDAPFYEPFLPNLLRNAVKWAGGLVMTLEVDVSNPTPKQGEEVELFVYLEDERGNIVTGASVWAVADGVSIDFYFSATAPFRYVGVLDTSKLLGDVEVNIYAYVEGLGTLHTRVPISITGRFIVDAWLDDATPAKGDTVRAYIRVSDYGGRPVEDATVDIIIDTTSISTTHISDGLYTADIDTSALSGSVSATVRVEKTGFETKEVPLAFDVKDQFIVYAWLDDATPTKGDTVRAYVRVNNYAGRPVEDATVSIILDTTTISATHVADGLYVADIDTSALSGSVSATVRVEKEGFETKEVPLAFEVEEPVEEPTPSLTERLIGDPLGLIALAGVALGLIGLSLGLVSFFKR